MIEVLSIRIYSLVYFCGLRSIMTGLFKTPSNLFSSQLDLLIHPFALLSQPIKCKWKCSTSRTVHDFPVTFVTSFAPAENYPVRKEPIKYFIYQILSLKHCSVFICISYRVPRPQVFTWSAHNYASQDAMTKVQDSRGPTFCGICAPSLVLCLVACQCNLCKFIEKYFVIFLFLSSFLASLCCREREAFPFLRHNFRYPFGRRYVNFLEKL